MSGVPIHAVMCRLEAKCPPCRTTIRVGAHSRYFTDTPDYYKMGCSCCGTFAWEPK